jgi:hypothetical protein
MADSPEENTTVTKNPDDIVMEGDDSSTQTAPTGTKTDYIAKELIKELTLPFKLVVKKKEDFQLTMIRHIEVMRAFSDCGKMSESIIYDNKNQKVTNFRDQKWKDVDYYKSHFTIHTGNKKLGMSFYVIHRIQTNMSVSTIKSKRKVYRALQANEGYLKAHQWREDIWKIQDIRFLLHYDSTKHPKEHVQTMLTDKFKYNGIKSNDELQFKLIHSFPHTKIKGEKLTTQAYSIQVESNNAAKMDRALKTAYKDEVKYMQYKMKGKMQSAYARAIQEQARFIKSIAVVSLYGITEDMMKYCKGA